MPKRYPPDDEPPRGNDLPDDIGNRREPPPPSSAPRVRKAGTLSLNPSSSPRAPRKPPLQRTGRTDANTHRARSGKPASRPQPKNRAGAGSGAPDRRTKAKKRATERLTIPPLKPDWVLEVQTRHAASLFQGRPAAAGKREIPGFADFIIYLNLVWERTLKDDPWADWYLWRTEQRIKTTRQALHDLRNQVAQLLETHEGVSLLDLGEADHPFSFPLAFAPPHGFQVAELIGLYDLVAQSILAARQSGRLDYPAAEQWLHQGARAVRGTYNSVYGYKNCLVNRVLLMKQTPHASAATAAMGPVPDEIVKRDWQPAMKPGPPKTKWFRPTKRALKEQNKSSPPAV